MAIDYGLKRCGIAVTDPLQIIAQPLETVAEKDLMPFLSSYIEKEEVEAIVLGIPYNLDGSLSDMCNEVYHFKNKLIGKFPTLTIHEVDERFTSKEAKRIVLASGKSKKKRREKGLLDRISASIILESFMNKKFRI